MTATNELQLDNGVFRVMKWTIDPGQHIPMHQHEYEYVVIPLVDGSVKVTSADGASAQSHMQAGVSYTRPSGTTHTLENVSDTPVVFVEVERL